MLKFFVVLYCLSMILADIGLALGQGSNTYLPPDKSGYDYPSPEGSFPSQPRPGPGPKIPAPTYTSKSNEEHQPGMPFDFNYAVNDVETSNDYNHNAVSDGDVTRGEYRVSLPDGRTQVVKYTADWKNGYNAEVTYEGEAQYPEDKKSFDGYKY